MTTNAATAKLKNKVSDLRWSRGRDNGWGGYRGSRLLKRAANKAQRRLDRAMCAE